MDWARAAKCVMNGVYDANQVAQSLAVKLRPIMPRHVLALLGLLQSCIKAQRASVGATVTPLGRIMCSTLLRAAARALERTDEGQDRLHLCKCISVSTHGVHAWSQEDGHAQRVRVGHQAGDLLVRGGRPRLGGDGARDIHAGLKPGVSTDSDGQHNAQCWQHS
jgi:hypothetical protein